jgi:hypothetical protein
MIETSAAPEQTTEPLTRQMIPDLIHTRGPCVTLLLPPYRPGEPAEPAAVLLKNDLQEAAKQLAARQVAEPVIAELLEPLRQLSHEDESMAGSGFARVIFRSNGVFREFELAVPPASVRACTVGECFSIRPALASLEVPSHVYVLEVTKKGVELLVCGFNEATPVDLPAGTPRTLHEALGFKAPDHDLSNRSSSGPSTGAMRGVQFGTGSGRETQHTYLRDFYKAVDRGVRELVGLTEAPLILAGVGEDVAIYRAVNTYSNLLEQGIPGSPGGAFTSADIVRRAHDIARFEYERRAASSMSHAMERLAPARFSTNLDVILRAASEGRVSDLYLDENANRDGDFDGKPFGGAYWRGEDLLNVAAVETLQHGGAVHSLASHSMPGGAAVAAAFRF